MVLILSGSNRVRNCLRRSSALLGVPQPWKSSRHEMILKEAPSYPVSEGIMVMAPDISMVPKQWKQSNPITMGGPR